MDFRQVAVYRGRDGHRRRPCRHGLQPQRQLGDGYAHGTPVAAASPPVSGLLIAGLYRLTKMENENTNAIIDSIHFGDKVPLMLVPAIFISTTITHLFGGSAGREGAALQIGGSLGCYIGRAFRLDDKDMRLATLCGMSAVFAALFGTPLTATLFALEVISVGVIYYSALVPCIVASLFALEMANIFGITPTHFDVVIEPISELMLLKVSALAIVCSLMSTVFCLSMHKTEHLFAKAHKEPVPAYRGGRRARRAHHGDPRHRRL